jgi:hypothetical protein
VLRVGEESMSTDLILNHRFDGYLFAEARRTFDTPRAFFEPKRD